MFAVMTLVVKLVVDQAGRIDTWMRLVVTVVLTLVVKLDVDKTDRIDAFETFNILIALVQPC